MQKFIKIKPIIDYSVRGLCKLSYSGNTKGCPNFNHKEGCPPSALFFDKVFDMNKSIFVIYNKYDLKGFADKMRTKHPGISKKQAECCLYWQNTARKSLTKKVITFLSCHENYFVCMAPYRGIEKDLGKYKDNVIFSPPEAMGVSLTLTMKTIGIELEWPPENVTYQIAIAALKI